MDSGELPASFCGPLHIRTATSHDLPEILDLFDTAVAWLVGNGLSGQWGTAPFSQNTARVDRFGQWIHQEVLYVACQGTRIVGTIVIGRTPPAYATQICAQHPRHAVYLEAFVTDRRLARRGIGAKLLQWAEHEAGQQGSSWLQLDCWGGNSELRSYYYQAGFREVDVFTVGDWQGVLFEKSVQPVPRHDA